MRSPGSIFQLRAAAIATAATLALGVAACGGSGDDGSGGDDEQQARATVSALYAGLKQGNAEKVCAQLNEAAQKQIEQGAQAAKGDSCAESFQKFLDSAKKSGGLDLALKAKVESVKVTGDTAVATVSFGSKGRTGEIPLEKVDGTWKLEAAGAASK